MVGREMCVLGLVLLCSAGPLAAQTEPDAWDASRFHATRAQLQALLARFETATESTGYSAHVRAIADDEADLIRTRLTEGDFQVGDQVILSVSGQPPLTATFTVTEGPLLVLPDIGRVPLGGLLRSELQEALEAHISKYIRNPQVHVQTQIRLAVFGQIATPGYHVAPSEALLTDFLMQAGGPTGQAEQKDIRVRRDGDVIWDGPALAQAMVEGRTLDQLNLRAGDEVEVPGGSSSGSIVLEVLRSLRYMVPGVLVLISLL